MDQAEIRATLEAALGDCEIQLQSEGNKLMLLVTAAAFDGLNRVKRQQLVYRSLGDRIESGEIHAVSMRCLTPEEAAQ